MILGALLDAGLPFDELKRALGSLAVEGWDISVDRVVKTGLTAAKFRVHEHSHAHAGGESQHARHHLKHIFAAIERSALSANGKAKASQMFRRLGEAEAAIHGTTLEKVHLHEVGALDSIIDIVGAVYALESLRLDRIVASPLNVGGGTIKSAHGVYPVPAPATLRLLEGVPIYSGAQQA